MAREGRKQPRVGGALALAWLFAAAGQLMEAVIEQAAAHSILNDSAEAAKLWSSLQGRGQGRCAAIAGAGCSLIQLIPPC